MISDLFPLLFSLKSYSLSDIKKDAIAGITVGVVLIPQAIAYAYLAGLPPIFGLYSSLLPLIIYALLGTSRHLSIGPVAITSILISTGLTQLATPFTPHFVELALLLGFMVGVIQIILGIFKVGFLVNIISQPVISGLISAAAVVIIISQLKSGFGIEIPALDSIFQSVNYFFFHLDESNPITIAISVFSIVVLLIFKRLPTNFPIAIVLIIGFIALSFYMDLPSFNVAVVGEIPEGLPSFYFPKLEWGVIKSLLPSVFTLTIIGYIGSYGIAKSFQMKHRNYEVNANKEFVALGFAKIIGTFFQGNLASGSYSRSAINEDAGAKTQISSFFTVVLVLATLMFLTSYLFFLPKAVLAAIILVSVLSLIKVKEAITYFKVKIDDFAIMMVTFIVSLIFSIEIGILSGVMLSFILLQYHSVKPHVAELVKIEGTNYFRNINRFKEGIQDQRFVIIRFDDQLYFGNAAYFKDSVYKILNKRKEKPAYLILHATNIHSIDSTGLFYLESLNKELKALDVELLFSATIGPVRDILMRSGTKDAMLPSKQFMSIEDALEYIESHKNINLKSDNLSLQYNSDSSFLSRLFK